MCPWNRRVKKWGAYDGSPLFGVPKEEVAAPNLLELLFMDEEAFQTRLVTTSPPRHLATSPPHHPTAQATEGVLAADQFAFVLAFALGVMTGYIVCACMMFAPSCVEEHEQVMCGQMMR